MDSEITIAADALASAIADCLARPEGLNPAEAIAAAGFLAGEYVLRAAPYDLTALPPGAPVESRWVESRLEEVSSALLADLAGEGVKVPDISALGPDCDPGTEPAKLAAALRPALADTLQKLPPARRVSALLLATGLLLAASRAALPPGPGAALALKAIIWGARTVPLPTADHDLAGAPPFRDFAA
jgi:hypothetical protein